MSIKPIQEWISSSQARARMAVLAGLVLTLGSGVAFSRLPEKEVKPTPVHLTLDDRAIVREGKGMTSFAPVVKKVAPSVVKVFTTTKTKETADLPQMDNELLRRFFGDPRQGPGSLRNGRQPKEHGLGSGVIVSEDGYILTNNHVVENASEVKVALTPNGQEYTAKVVGTDPKTDIAVLKIDGKKLPFITLADSEKIEVGDLVMAVGNPFGIGQTVTMGMVSATGRAALGLDYEDFIQTDAAINPGNSGGALVDAEGRLIGINTAIFSRSGGNQGIGFAVPTNLARNVMESLVKDGRVVRGYMGILLQDVTPSLAQAFGLKDTKGALVGEVMPKSPAEKAGFVNGDVIMEFNGRPVSESRLLRLQVSQISPGTKVPVKVLRNGKEKRLDIALQELPGDKKAAQDNSPASSGEDVLDGVTVSDIDGSTRNALKLPPQIKGAVVTQVTPDSAAEVAGLKEGDVIQEIDRQPVTSAEEAVTLSEKTKKDSILLRVWSRGASRYVVVKSGETR